MNILSRIHNFTTHLIHPFLGNRNQFNLRKYKLLYPINFIVWLILIPIKLFEIIGLAHFLNFIFNSITKTRDLTPFEINELKSIFKNSINYSNIHINETSKWA